MKRIYAAIVLVVVVAALALPVVYARSGDALTGSWTTTNTISSDPGGPSIKTTTTYTFRRDGTAVVATYSHGMENMVEQRFDEHLIYSAHFNTITFGRILSFTVDGQPVAGDPLHAPPQSSAPSSTFAVKGDQLTLSSGGPDLVLTRIKS